MPELKGDSGLWLRHNLKVSLRRNTPLCGVLSPLRVLSVARRRTGDERRKAGFVGRVETRRIFGFHTAHYAFG